MNLNGRIIGASGREVFGLGGRDSWKTVIHRGYFVSLEWFLGAKSTEPMLVVKPAGRMSDPDCGAFGICLSSVGIYCDPSGLPASTALAACKDALETLDREVCDREARLLLDVVMRWAPELILMPPTPKAVLADARAERAPIAHVTLTDERTGKVHHEQAL